MTKTVSTLPVGSFDATRFNALRHGVLSRYTVLPWEDVGEYRALLEALSKEHAPQGPTEEHLVEELAGIVWRKRRLRLAEAAAYRRGLEDTLQPYQKTVKAALVHFDATDETERVVDSIRATEDDTTAELADMAADESVTRRALDLLGKPRNDAYEAALDALREDTRQWWHDVLSGEVDQLSEDEPYTTDATGLSRFLEEEVLPWFDMRRKELANRPLIREQAFGEALNVHKLEGLGRYEVHLDRKLQRTLAMLFRLKDLRPVSEPE